MSDLLTKYEDTIKEELNVKNVSQLDQTLEIQKIFKPIGSQISAKFGKDTWNIIKFGKMWKIEELDNWQVKVIWEWSEWILDTEDYEVAYEWLDDSNTAVDQNVIVKLDLEITPELKQEWIAREISRHLNQMRKEADFSVDAKVEMYYDTKNTEFEAVINTFSEFLKTEALLSGINKWLSDWNIESIFNLDEQNITFVLKK